MVITKEMLLNTYAKFTWDFGNLFFLETDIGNFVWSNPEYGGDNTMTQYSGSITKWITDVASGWARDKGQHEVEKYCGNQFLMTRS